jgi:hypothetical protein
MRCAEYATGVSSDVFTYVLEISDDRRVNAMWTRQRFGLGFRVTALHLCAFLAKALFVAGLCSQM